MTGDELNDMWVVRVGLQTLTHEGTTVEIRIDDDSVHYVVNGVECDSRYLDEGVSPRDHVIAFKRRVVDEWEKGQWPPG